MLFADLQCWFTVKPEKNKKNKRTMILFSHYFSKVFGMKLLTWQPHDLASSPNCFLFDVIVATAEPENNCIRGSQLLLQT